MLFGITGENVAWAVFLFMGWQFMNQGFKGQWISSNGNCGKVKTGKASSGIVPNPKLKLLDQVREVMRLLHYAISTERSYCDWIRRYVHFHKMQTRDEMLSGPRTRIERFLSHLAVEGNVSASTQNQALNALVFFYEQVLQVEFGNIGEFTRADSPVRLFERKLVQFWCRTVPGSLVIIQITSLSPSPCPRAPLRGEGKEEGAGAMWRNQSR